MGTKICTSCFVEKDLTEGFYVHFAMGDGYLNKCKECVKSRVKNHRERNVEAVRAYDRKRYHTRPERKAAARKSHVNWLAKNPEGQTITAREWRKRNPEKYAAQNAVNNAIRRGKLLRQGCVVCGEKAHAHHEDYSKPLDVIWLCPTHHSRHHVEKREKCRM